MSLANTISEVNQTDEMSLDRLEHVRVEGHTQNEIKRRFIMLAELEEFDFIDYEVHRENERFIGSGFGVRLRAN